MSKVLRSASLPVLGGGEQSAAAPGAFEPPRGAYLGAGGIGGGAGLAEVKLMENGLITGPGVVLQQPDWLTAYVTKDLANSVESHVVLGIFSFQQQGDQGTPTAGVVIHYNATAQIAYLDQIDEALALQRRLILYGNPYVPPVFPQMSGLEIFGKFYLCDYPNNSSATQRVGLAVFNPFGLALVSSSNANPTVITVSNASSGTPLDDIGIVTGTKITIDGHSIAAVNGQWTVTKTGATTFTIPVASTGGGATGAIYIVIPRYALVGGTPAPLRPRGISLHRGGTLLLWGYGDENIPDQVHLLRWAKYTAPDNFTADTTDTTPGKAVIGTLNVPIVGCAMTGSYSVLGKQNEVYALEGDFAAQFYTGRQLGNAHGPISTPGLVSIGDAAVWMAESGPAVSERGGNVQRLGIDKITRRFLNYMDLTTCCGAHDSFRQRVVWAMRRKLDDLGIPVDADYRTEQFIWDYARNQYYVSSLPKPIFCLGVTKGPGTNLPGPTGVVSAILASAITSTSAVLNWTAGDTHSDVSFIVQFRINGQTAWIPGGTTPAGTTSLTLTGLGQGQIYDVRVQQTRNSRTSAWVESLALFTTIQVTLSVVPTNVVATEYRDVFNSDGTSSAFNHVAFTPYNDPLLVVDLAYDRDTAQNPGVYDCSGTVPGVCNVVGHVPASSGLIDDPTEWTGLGRAGSVAPQIYYQVRMRNPANNAVSAWVPATPFPLVPKGRGAVG